jgi:hypothetical protein
MNDVVLDYQLTWPEYRRLAWLADPKKHSLSLVVYLIPASVLAIGGADYHWTLAAAIFGVGLPITSFLIAPRFKWNNEPSIRGPKTTTVDNERLTFASEQREVILEWTQISRTRETRNFFVFHSKKPYGAYFVPKRGLHSIDDEEKLRRFIESRVPRATQR